MLCSTSVVVRDQTLVSCIARQILNHSDLGYEVVGLWIQFDDWKYDVREKEVKEAWVLGSN